MSNYNIDPVKLTFEMTGEEMENGFNLYYINKSLTEFHNILDKSYLILSNRKKITENDRKSYQIKAITIEKGSFIADMLLICSNTIITLPFVCSLTPKSMWEIAKQGYQYLKFILGAFQKGEQINIENTGNNNIINVTKGDTNVNIQIYSEAQTLASAAFGDYLNLVSNIGSGKGIGRIRIGERNTAITTGIAIEENDKTLFQNTKRLSKYPAVFKGKIYRIDGHSFSGRLTVVKSDNQEISTGDYAYELLNEEDIELCKSAFMKEKKITALSELAFSPSTLKEIVVRFRIIAIEG